MEELLKNIISKIRHFDILDATRGKVLTHEQDQGVWNRISKILMKDKGIENIPLRRIK